MCTIHELGMLTVLKSDAHALAYECNLSTRKERRGPLSNSQIPLAEAAWNATSSTRARDLPWAGCFLEPSLDPISRALARSVRGQSGGLAKARPNLSESAELQTDLARTSPKLG
ncbi:hypothetical protein B0H14DRAFT_3480996 [Mycena olivaceomarginata]|nr:hypothetical protein B0H14DRAFT_3480996 [Mycena olivaceomarginata]